MTWDDLTAEEREVLVRVGTDQPWPLTNGEWLGRWADVRITALTWYARGDDMKIAEAAWAEICRRYSNRPRV